MNDWAIFDGVSVKVKSEDCCPPAQVAEEVVEIDFDELASLAKALGHPARVQILELLLRRKSCICSEIVEELPLAQSTVSQHLKTLKEAGFIRGEIDGPRVCYCVEPSALARLHSHLRFLMTTAQE